MSLKRTSTLSRKEKTKEEEKSAKEKRTDQLNALKEYLEQEAKNPPAQYKSKTNKTIKFDATTLFLAASALGDLKEVENLILKGVDVNGANSEGLTALHEAVAQENVEMIELLLKHGANLNVQDNEGWTPLHAVCQYGFPEIVKLLLGKNADYLVTNFDNHLPIDLIEDEELQAILEEHMASKGVTEEVANAKRNLECNKMLDDVTALLKDNPLDINGQADDGTSLLHIACGKGYLAVVLVLLEKNANPNISDHEGWTPMHVAAYWDQTLMFEPLMTFGGDLDLVNKDNETALDLAENAETREKLEELREKFKKKKGGLTRNNSSAALRRGLKMGQRNIRKQNEEDEFPKSPTKD